MQQDNLPIIIVHERKVSCDGSWQGNKTLGHPKVYFEISAENEIECPYCGQAFVYRPSQEL